ncbi:hypothetical protein ACWEQL_31775 [Kitasatospora sp. NPDC004240]
MAAERQRRRPGAGAPPPRKPGFPCYIRRARLLVTALDRGAPDLGERLAELAVLVAERPALTGTLAAAGRLAADDGLAPGLFAVALTSVGTQLGWPTAWREVLHALRRHPRPDVRDAALAVFPDPA